MPCFNEIARWKTAVRHESLVDHPQEKITKKGYLLVAHLLHFPEKGAAQLHRRKFCDGYIILVFLSHYSYLKYSNEMQLLCLLFKLHSLGFLPFSIWKFF